MPPDANRAQLCHCRLREVVAERDALRAKVGYAAAIVSGDAGWQSSERAERAEAERDDAERRYQSAQADVEELRALLAGFSGPSPSPRQWADICNKAAELRAALREGK